MIKWFDTRLDGLFCLHGESCFIKLKDTPDIARAAIYNQESRKYHYQTVSNKFDEDDKTGKRVIGASKVVWVAIDYADIAWLGKIR
jgi:hypothetical protein